MNKKRVVVFDDEEQTRSEWMERLNALDIFRQHCEGHQVTREIFLKALGELRERQKKARVQYGKGGDSYGDNLLDQTDILIVDYDLFSLDGGFTGEEVAYLARCFSRCGVIVALNQYGDNEFDLTLRGHPESFADMNVGGSQVANKGLWGGDWQSYRPWHWPVLPLAVDKLQQRVSQLSGNLDESMLSFLGFKQEIIHLMPQGLLEAIEGEESPELISFRQFVTSSKMGLRGKDRPLSDEAIARISAARVAKWLERVVLPGQDILVDAPHLIQRFPSLVKNLDREFMKSEAFGSSMLEPPEDIINRSILEDFRFPRHDWLSRLAWFWPQVSACEAIEEVKNPWGREDLGLVFCEDVSRFLSAEDAREFVTDLESQFVQRFVSPGEAGISYRPAVRLAL